MRVGLTADFVDAAGNIILGEEPLRRLRAVPGVEISVIEGRATNHPLEPDDVTGHDILITKRNRLGADLLILPGLRLKHVARMGVGFDHIDIDACNRAGVLVTITPEAVRRPMASAIMALILALAHRLFERDRLTRAGNWATRHATVGTGLGGRTLGLIGAGNIGSDVIRLAAPFGMRVLLDDPSCTASELGDMSAEAGPLDEVLQQSDFLVLACPLNDETRGLINAKRLAMMKPTAFLVNLARGELVEQAALVEALQTNGIAGAAIDVFESEPASAGNPLFQLPNVILGQHNLGITDEMDRIGHQAVVQAVFDVCQGRRPASAVNPDVWVETLRRFAR